MPGPDPPVMFLKFFATEVALIRFQLKFIQPVLHLDLDFLRHFFRNHREPPVRMIPLIQ